MSSLAGLLLLALAACGGSAKTDAGADDGGRRDAPDLDAPGEDTGPLADTGAPADAPGDATGDDAGAGCGTDPWVTYAHDARRTSASDGCVAGPLSQTWSYTPTPPEGRTLRGVFRAVARDDLVILSWKTEFTRPGGFPGMGSFDRVSPDGERVWTWENGWDAAFGYWPTIALGNAVMNDDGLYYVSLRTGMRTASAGNDIWGYTAPGTGRVFVVNDIKVDGPGVFVGAYDGDARPIWRENQAGSARLMDLDNVGAIAVAGDTLFLAADYSAGVGLESGLYSFAAGDGTPGFHVALSAWGAMSVGSGRIYLVEDGGTRLVARRQSNGNEVWSAMLAGGGQQAPVLAGDLVIIATSAAVEAYHADSGEQAWTAPVAGAATTLPGGAFQVSRGTETHLAAALGSGTLLVATGSGLRLLDLATGDERWSGMPAGRDPVIVGRRVYMISAGGELLALDPG